MKWVSMLIALLPLSLLPGQGQHVRAQTAPVQTAPAPVRRTYRFTNGQWFDGKTFTPQTFYTVNGVLTRQPPPVVDETRDLQGGYVVPPFGDAHCHHFDARFSIGELTEMYLKDGVFYAQTMANSRLGASQVADKVNIPTGVDVGYAHACLTCNNGHPIRIYEGLALGYFSYADQFAHKAEIMKNRRCENDCYVILDTSADVERKWPQILAGKPDLIKVILSHSENYQKQIKEAGHAEGLDPTLLPDIVKRAHAAGLRVAAHVDTADDYRNALRSGVDIMAHLCGYYLDPSENIAAYQLTGDDAALTAKRGVTVIPTVNLAGPVSTDPNWVRIHENQIRNLTLLKKAGVRFGVGRDNYGSDAQPEALYMSDMGVWSNLELLKIWCESTPRLIFPHRKIGFLRDGYEASFVVLDKNPLEAFSNVKTVRLGVKQGVVLPTNPENKARQILHDASEATKALTTLTGDIDLQYQTPGKPLQKSHGAVELMRPNYALLTLQGTPAQTLASDGTSRFLLDATEHYTQVPVDGHGANVNDPWWGLPFRYFFTQSLSPFGDQPDPTAAFRYTGSQSENGVSYEVVEMKGETPMAYVATLMFGPDKLLHRSSVVFPGGSEKVFFAASLSQIQKDKPLTASHFRYQLPTTAQIDPGFEAKLPALGKTAPPFVLPALNGGSLSLSEASKGARGTLVNFWYLHCPPCLEELPYYQKQYADLGGQGLAVVTVNKGDTAPVIRDYWKAHGYSLPVVLGTESDTDVFHAYGVEAFPVTLLLDGNGKVVFRSVGFDEKGLDSALDTLGFKRAEPVAGK